ncbi:39S ribosomal protein L19, mitochondrial [Teleopsis dalmanni]|uniref:39S ribosomal protein L19, mitochondrial n=1 Tax=Teleopsis dalmanni TaxID=139649 RepID=UPI0018CF267E|nr:39S ribosomal protein L19, mitochondrial [Teleopsis dalmanni]
MNVSSRFIIQNIVKNDLKRIVPYSTKPQVSETNQQQRVQHQSNENSGGSRKPLVPATYRFVYPEFLPDPKIEWRNHVREKLERMDMVNRRTQIDIPEFYVGSVLAVTSSDPHSVGKITRFVGICIHREFCGLSARFILRNVIDHQGVEVLYEMYDPTIQKIEVLRLEKRLDDKLFYLRDALPEYSTFDVNMEPEQLEEGAEVPINPIKVVLRPRPWLERWERQNLQGVVDTDSFITDKMRMQKKKHETPWEKYDMMKQYRATIPEEEQRIIYADVHSQLHQLELQRKKNKRKRSFIKPTQLA